MVANKGSNCLYSCVGKFETSEDVFGHVSAMAFVSGEPDSAIFGVAAHTRRFTDIVEEYGKGEYFIKGFRSDFEHQNSMSEHVTFRMKSRGLLDVCEVIDFGKEDAEKAGIFKHPEGEVGARPGEHFYEFFVDAFRADIERWVIDYSLPSGGFGLEIKFGAETYKAKLAEVVFGKTFRGTSDSPDKPVFDICAPAKKVEDFACCGIFIHSVDSEITPASIESRVITEFYFVGMPPVGITGITAESCDFKPETFVFNHLYAEGFADGNNIATKLFPEDFFGDIRRRADGDVIFLRFHAHDSAADGTAHPPGAVAPA